MDSVLKTQMSIDTKFVMQIEVKSFELFVCSVLC